MRERQIYLKEKDSTNAYKWSGKAPERVNKGALTLELRWPFLLGIHSLDTFSCAWCLNYFLVVNA